MGPFGVDGDCTGASLAALGMEKGDSSSDPEYGDISDGTLRLLGLPWSLAEPGGPLLLEEPELSLHDALVSRLAGLMARMNRTTGRQVLVTTHSVTLLRDPGIDPSEIHLPDPGEDGTVVRSAAALDNVVALIEQGFSPGEAIMPRAAASDAHQLLLSF